MEVKRKVRIQFWRLADYINHLQHANSNSMSYIIAFQLTLHHSWCRMEPCGSAKSVIGTSRPGATTAGSAGAVC